MPRQTAQHACQSLLPLCQRLDTLLCQISFAYFINARDLHIYYIDDQQTPRGSDTLHSLPCTLSNAFVFGVVTCRSWLVNFWIDEVQFSEIMCVDSEK
jgi:hypothetical protein